MSNNPSLATEQLLELLLTLKKTTPTAARGILNAQPAIAYALITLMVSMNAINIEVFQKTLAEFQASAANLAQQSAAAAAAPTPSSSAPPHTSTPPQSQPQAVPAQLSAIPPHLQSQYRTTTPPQAQQLQPAPPQAVYGGYPNAHGAGPSTPPVPPQAYPPASTNPSYGHPHAHIHTPPNQQHQYGYGQPPTAYPGYPPTSYGTPVPAAPQPTNAITDALAAIPDDQKALIMRVIGMTPEQLNMLPPAERSTYIQIRATLGIS